MVSLDTQNKLPRSVLGYLLVSRIILGLILIIGGIIFISLGTLHGNSTVNGVTTPSDISGSITGIILIVLGTLIPLSSVIWYLTFSYIISASSITINSGIIFRQSRTIDLHNIQNINNVRGPIQMLFGLTTVNIWTASPDQLTINTNSRGVRTTSAHPDGKLYLPKQDAEDLKNMMSNSGSVQNVKIVA